MVPNFLPLGRIQVTRMTVSEILRFHGLVMCLLLLLARWPWWWCIPCDGRFKAFLMGSSRSLAGFSWKVLGRINVSGSNLTIESWVQFFYCWPFCTCCASQQNCLGICRIQVIFVKKNGDNLCVLLGLILCRCYVCSIHLQNGVQANAQGAGLHYARYKHKIKIPQL